MADRDWGAFALRPQSYLWSSLSLGYGIANWLQVWIAASHGVEEGPALAYMTFASLVKLRMTLGSGLDLAFPLGVGFVDRQGGAVASVRLGVATAHGGVDVGFVKGGGWYLHPYAIVDYDVLPTVKLVAELRLVPLSVGVGAWLRLLDFLDLKLALAPLAPSLTGGVYLRF